MPQLTLSEKLIAFGVSAPVICLALLVFGRFLKRRHGVGLGFFYKLFCLSIAAYLPVEVLEMPFKFARELGAVTALLGSIFGIALIKRYLWEIYFHERKQTKIPKLLTDVVALLIFTVTLVAILEVEYNVALLKGFLTGSGIVVVILGFALQDLLGNIFAGFAIHFGKPFDVGDWLILENRHAEVMEVNWRSTRLRTTDDVYLDIPNREIARQTLVNVNYATKTHAMRFSVNADYNAPPNRVKDALLHATANAAGVLPLPKPVIFLKNFGDHSIEYEIKFWLDNHARLNDISDTIRSNVWYEFHRQGIKIPFPIRTLQIERRAAGNPSESLLTARTALRQLPLFQCLDDAHLDGMLPHARVQHFGRGEKLIEQGDDADSMFILVRGDARVLVNQNSVPTEVAQLRAGDCFGEMSLLTGEKRSATVVAQSDCEVVEIVKAVIGGFFAENPHLLQLLSGLLAKRRLENEGVLAGAEKNSSATKEAEYTTTFLQKLRGFFEL